MVEEEDGDTFVAKEAAVLGVKRARIGRKL